MSKKYKYITSFSSEINPVEVKHLKESIANDSLDSLKSLIPEDIDFEKNIDLIGVAFNAAVINKFNRNGDGIDSETALKIKDYFINKPTNIEHQKSKIVGHIVSAGFSQYGTNEIMSEAFAEKEEDPFNLALSAVIYKTINTDFVDLVQRSFEEEDEMYKKISASWEIGFNKYHLALGSTNLNEAEIISDENQISEMGSFLKQNGGSGKTEDGVDVFRLIVGEVYPLGIGFTTNPAADVKGITPSKKTTVSLNIKDSRKANENNLEKKSEKSSHLSEKDVFLNKKPNDLQTMNQSEILEKLQEILANKNSDSEVEKVVANVNKLLHDTILEKNEIWKKEKENLENEKAQITEDAQATKDELEKVKADLSNTHEELNTIKTEFEAKIASEKFNQRMEEIDSAFDLEDEDRKIIASELKGLGNEDSQFSEYLEKLNASWKYKTKAFKEEQEKLFEEKVQAEIESRLTEMSAKANEEGAEEVTEAAIENAEKDEELPNNNAEACEEELSIRQKFMKAFNKEDVSIQY